MCEFIRPLQMLAQSLKLAIDAGGLGFDSQVGQMGSGNSVANGSPPLRRYFRAVLRNA